MPRDYADILNGTFGDEPAAPAAALSFIFGSSARVLGDFEAKEERRAAVYPCLTEAESSEIVQGLMCALTWELNALEGVTAIPLLTRAPAATWRVEDSAFTPDNFILDGLGEDSLLSAALKRDTSGLTLVITGSADIEDVEDLVIELKAASEHELFLSMIDTVPRISGWLDAAPALVSETDKVRVSSSDIHQWLSAAFAWHRATVADAAAENPLDLTSQVLQNLITASNNDRRLTNLVIRGLALAMVWFEAIEVNALTSTLKLLPYWQESAAAIARALLEMSKTREALELLELAVEEAPEFVVNWLVLARLYIAAQQPAMAIETLQIAIERHQTYAPLLIQYGDVLVSAADQNIPLEEVIFIEEDLEPAAAYEAIAAYEEAVRLLSDDQRSMAYVQLITALARYHPENIWRAFQDLVVSDTDGLYAELALNAIAAQEEIGLAIASLEKAARANPNSERAWRNLAYAQYLAGDKAGASVAIEQALQHVRDPRARGEYELLSVYIQDPAIEVELAEIADRLSAEGEVTDRALELLEWTVTEAPHYIEGYLLLGRAYAANDEGSTALEVLLDAENILGADADIYVAIIDLLLEANEETVALDYVTKALDGFPRHVPLLARAALVTDALGDREGAKAFLRQAHNIVPYHPEIMRVTGIFRESEND